MRTNTARVLKDMNELGLGKIVRTDPASVTIAAKPAVAPGLFPKEILCCILATD